MSGGILSSCSLKLFGDAASDGELCNEELNKICVLLEGNVSYCYVSN